MNEQFSWLGAAAEILALPALLAVGIVAAHFLLRRREQQQFGEYIDTMPGFRTDVDDPPR